MPQRFDVMSSVLMLSLLSTHQVDAAYWHEWEVFGVPGGIEGFLGFNLAAMLLVTTGLVAVATGHRWARRLVVGCAAVGLVTCGIHAAFLVRDREAFATVASLATLAAMLMTAIAQLAWVGLSAGAAGRRALVVR